MSTAATPVGSCHLCGGILYEYLTHLCSTAAIPQTSWATGETPAAAHACNCIGCWGGRGDTVSPPRISLTDLRGRAMACMSTTNDGPWLDGRFSAKDVLALVEAVEAAEEVSAWRHFDAVGAAGREKRSADYDRLDEALARFEFGDGK